MKIVLFRFVVVWLLLHVVLFFIEWYRYKHSDWSWYGFKMNGMLVLTYCVWFIDTLAAATGIVCGIGYWIFLPVID